MVYAGIRLGRIVLKTHGGLKPALRIRTFLGSDVGWALAHRFRGEIRGDTLLERVMVGSNPPYKKPNLMVRRRRYGMTGPDSQNRGFTEYLV